MEVPTTDDTSIINRRIIGNLTEDLPSFMEEAENHMTYKVAVKINYYWFLILAPTGLLGNTLSFLVMMKPNNRKMSTCIYMSAISINDNLRMLQALHNWLVSSEQMIVQCKTVTFLTGVVIQNSRYLVLAMTIDKYVAIKWQHKAATYSTPRRAKFILISVFICTLIYNTPHIFMTGLVGGKCRGFIVGGIISEIFIWVSFIVNGLISLSLLLFMNFVIVQVVKISGKLFGATTNLQQVSHANMGMDTRQRKMKSAENQLTTMLLLVTVLYLVLQIPEYVRNIYVKFATPDTLSEYVSLRLIVRLTYALSITSSGINFFLYCISGQKFRNDLKEMLCCRGKSLLRKSECQSNKVLILSASENTQNSNTQCDHKGSIQ